MLSGPGRLTDRWSDSLSALLAVDLGSAALSAALVAPVVTVIDRAVVEKSQINTSLLRVFNKHTLCVLRQPRRFFIAKPFFIVWTLYAATYSTANVTETLARDLFRVADKATISSAAFISTFLVNVPLGLWKDVRFAQFYGAIPDHSITRNAKTSPPLTIRGSACGLPVSMGVYATFLLRDGLTIFGSLLVPPSGGIIGGHSEFPRRPSACKVCSRPASCARHDTTSCHSGSSARPRYV
ncbi:hypothetical protein B7463_g2251, partial [Scytalidium lignicola]